MSNKITSNNAIIDPKVMNLYYCFKCSEIKRNLINCFERLDKKILMKKSLMKKCENIETEYYNCILSNNITSTTENVSTKKEINLEYLNNIEETKKMVLAKIDFMDGRISKENLKSNLNKNVKLIEL